MTYGTVMETIDFKKQFKAYYSPKPGKPEILTIPKMQFAMVDGQGDPNNSNEFEDAIGALYSTVYGLKFARKKTGKQPDFTIGALEGLWWTPSGKDFDMGKKKDWLWTVMIWLPDFISSAELKAQVEIVKVKKPNSALEKIRLESFEEGLVAQIMHIGPYADEQPNIEKMHAYAAKPEKLKTILRHPLQRA